ncbi:hypothetical protein Hdeb2414_s0002g00055351 [Helianthus debilis subsp. tardiflorus]
MGVNKEFRRRPSIEVVTPPYVRAEDTGKKAADQTIVDTVDSPDNLINPRNVDVEGSEKPKSPEAKKPDSPIANEKSSGSIAAGMGVEDQPSIQLGETELEFYYRSYAENRSMNYHRPPWTVMQGDNIFNDPPACKDILSGLGTLFEVLRARGLPRENRINQLSSMLVGSSIMANSIIEDYKVLGRNEEEIVCLRAEAAARAARKGAEQLEIDRAAFEKLKQTKAWAATAGFKQVRTLAKLLSDERKGWREACARKNEKLFRVRQELTNLKEANAALMKEKAAVEAVAKEPKEAEGRGAKALEKADADRNNLNKVVEDLKAEVPNRVTILEEVSARATEAETRAREATEARDSLTISLDPLREDRDWMRHHGIGHIVGTILDAPENASAINELKERAREVGFKAGYNECLNYVNPFYKSKFTDERSRFHGVDTEVLYVAAINAYINLSISAIEDIVKCLEAEDYVERLQLLYYDPEEEEEEEEETAGGLKGDAGTSGTKED